MYSSRLYKYSPRIVQEIMISARNYVMDYMRTSGKYMEYRELINDTQWMSISKLKEYQQEKVKQIYTTDAPQ